LPRDLKKKLEKASSKNNQSLSEYIRTIFEKHVEPAKVDTWKIVLWSLFDINLTKINYGLVKSASVEEFFSYMANYVDKKIKIRPTVIMGQVELSFIVGNREYTIKQPEDMSLSDSLATIIEELEAKIMEDYDG